MSQNDRTQLIPDPKQPSRPTDGVQSPRPITPTRSTKHGSGNTSQRQNLMHISSVRAIKRLSTRLHTRKTITRAPVGQRTTPTGKNPGPK